MQPNRFHYLLLTTVFSFSAGNLAAQTPAETTTPSSTPAGAAGTPALEPKTTRVLAILSVKEGVTRPQIMNGIRAEILSTVQLYLDGKIEQWYSRGDGKGVVFIFDCKSVAEAKEITATLPFVKDGLATFEYMPLGPLTPLRALMSPAAPGQPKPTKQPQSSRGS